MVRRKVVGFSQGCRARTRRAGVSVGGPLLARRRIGYPQLMPVLSSPGYTKKW